MGLRPRSIVFLKKGFERVLLSGPSRRYRVLPLCAVTKDDQRLVPSHSGGQNGRIAQLNPGLAAIAPPVLAQIAHPTAWLDSENKPAAGREAGALARAVLVPQQRNKIAYVTDGAASPENARKIERLIEGADLLFAESCFLECDRAHAEATQHFTAGFIGSVAARAGVRAFFPIHLSKRYLECPEAVIEEVREAFRGRVVSLAVTARVERR